MTKPTTKKTLRDEIVEQINYNSFYSEYFDNLKDNAQNDGLKCPFHDDTVGSLSLDLQSGVYFCHGSCAKGGGVFNFVMGINHCDFRTALTILAKKLSIKEQTVSEQLPFNDIQFLHREVDANHKFLIQDKLKQEYLSSKRGISLAVIKNLKLGWSQKEGRTWFPILSPDKRIINIRKHQQGAERFKVIGIKGHNNRVLWPLETVDMDGPIHIFAGEMDCCHALSLGVRNCLTQTASENGWNPEFNVVFKGRDINIVYDNDNAGKLGAYRIATALLPKAKSVKIIVLPVTGKGEDFTDYIINYNKDLEGFTKFCNTTLSITDAAKGIKYVNYYDAYTVAGKVAKKKEKGQPKEKKEKSARVVDVQQDVDLTENEKHDLSSEVIETTLEDSSDGKYNFKKIKIEVHVIGKDYTPYIVPRELQVRCNVDQGIKCETCPMANRMLTNDDGIKIRFDDYTMLKFVDTTNLQKHTIIKSFIRANCITWRTVVTENVNFEELMLAPKVSYKKDKHEDVIRKAYYMGQGIPTNSSLDIVAMTVPSPKTQHATQIIYKATGSATDIDNFSLSDEDFEKLKIFQPTISIDRKLKEIHEDLSYNILRVYDRFELFLTMNLVWYSPLNIRFRGDQLKKSHVEALIVGDTRTGKSKMAERLMEHYQAGELLNCEKATIPGLIGGIVTTNNSQILQWGAIPLNHRRLCILDESDGLSQEVIANMSGIRSSCIAERNVAGGTRRTLAKTRLLWISNPRGFSDVRDANNGVEIIKQLIGKPEDIARFDIATIVSKDDVSLDTISEKEMETREHKYTTELCSKLIKWAWSRKIDDVIFTDTALTEVDVAAKELSTRYTSEIALVHPAEQRIKMVRMAASMAAMTFSTEDGKNLIIRKAHVQYITYLLKLLYDAPMFGYDVYSKMRMRNSEFTVQERAEIDAKLKYYGETFVDNMLNQHSLKIADIMAFTGTRRDDANEFIFHLQKFKAIKKVGAKWIKTEAFKKLLREHVYGRDSGSQTEEKSEEDTDFMFSD